MSMSSNVQPFIYGDHLHYAGMPPCDDCEQQRCAWEAITRKYTSYELATKITKTRAWRAYRQAKPFDEYEPTLSLDRLMEEGYDPQAIGTPEEDMLDREFYDEFRQTLTQKQASVMERLVAGYSSREITDNDDYRTTGGVRYHRYVIRKKYRRFKDEERQA